MEKDLPVQPTRKLIGIHDVRFGSDVTVVEPVNLYGCTIGDRCFIGPFTEIQRSVVVGRECRIQSHAFICELVTIGDRCFVSHGAKFVNDLMRDGQPEFLREKWLSTSVGDDVVIGTNATILPVTICAGAVVGAGAVVTRDITEPGFYAGNPARLLRRIAARGHGARGPQG